MLNFLFLLLFSQANLKEKADSLDKIVAEQIKSGDFENALKTAEELLTVYEKIGEKKNISDCLATIGFIYGKLNDFDKASELYNQSLEIKNAIADSAGILEVLFLSGVLYKDFKRFKESASNFETALLLAEKLKQISLKKSIVFGLAQDYFEIGEIFLKEEEKDSAEYYYLKAIDNAKIVNDTITLIQVYHSLGATYVYLFNDSHRGRKAYLNALQLYHIIKDREGEVDLLNDLCESYFVIPDHSIASGIEYGKKALSLADSIDYLDGYSTASENLGDLHRILDNFYQSAEYYNQCLETLKKINDNWTMARILYKISRLYFEYMPADTTLKICRIGQNVAQESNNQDYLKLILGIEYLVHSRRYDYDNAIKTKEKLLDIYRSEDNTKELVNTLIDLANAYLNKDDYKKFKTLYTQTETLIQEINYIEGEVKILMLKGEYYLKNEKTDSLIALADIIFPKLSKVEDKELISDVYNWLSSVAFVIGDFKKSIELLENGLKIIDGAISAINTRDQIAIIKKQSLYSAKSYLLLNTGVLYQSIGFLQKAEEFYKKAIKIAREETGEKDFTKFHTNLALVYLQTGDYEQFNNYLNDVEMENFKNQNTEGQAFVLQLRSIEMIKKGQWKKAIEFLKRVDSLKSKPNLLYPFLLGIAYRGDGDYKNSLLMFNRALKSPETSYSPQLQGIIMTEIGSVSLALNDLNNARWFFESARKSFDIIDTTYNTVELEMGWAALALKNKDTINAIPHYKKAIQIVERVSANLSNDLMKVALASSGVSAYEKLIEIMLARKDYAEAFNYSERSRGRAFLDLLGTAELKLKPDNRLYMNEIKEKETKLAFLSGDLKIGEKKISGPEIKDIQSKIIEIRKEIERTRPEIASFVSVQAVGLKELQNLIKNEIIIEYYFIGEEGYVFLISNSNIEVFNLTKRYSEISNLCEYFRSSLMKTQPPFDQEFYEPANELYNILIAPIIDRITNHKTYVVPYGVLHYLPFNALYDGKNFLIENTEVCYLPSASALKFLRSEPDKKEDKKQFLGIANPDLGDTALSLKFAEEEVKTIAPLFIASKVFYKGEASEGKVVSYGKDYDIIHFACHGIFNESKPLYSALLLSKDRENDGRLQAYELFGIELKEADLIVLSACQTALARLTKGEDLIGLSRGFFYAGTPSLVASLWKVDDQSTGYLMSQFYKNLNRGMDKAVALKNAQIVTKEKFPHPFFWAPFILIGDWR
ncbi:MAG: CHAT domain-containing protein [candidate division WOR-3 bacterium]